MKTEEIIGLLKERKADFSKTKSFSDLPGIYAFFYIGNNFPILQDSVSKNEIIYIGKTESSQNKRNSKTHFKTGKTGSSTVRKSIGSLLFIIDDSKPIPRNETDYESGRFSHFKFELDSEEKITKWMKNNLALSFFEYPRTKKEIEDLETEIIERLKPVLNIDNKNPSNPFKAQIKQLRKNCATIAIKNSEFKSNAPNIKKAHQKIKAFPKSEVGVIFIDNITKNDAKSRNIRIKVNDKYLFPQEKQGNRETYLLNFKVGNIEFIGTYIIGSKDGKSRSGILKLGDKIYQEKLKIKASTNLKITNSKNVYTIEKL